MSSSGASGFWWWHDARNSKRRKEVECRLPSPTSTLLLLASSSCLGSSLILIEPPLFIAKAQWQITTCALGSSILLYFWCSRAIQEWLVRSHCAVSYQQPSSERMMSCSGMATSRHQQHHCRPPGRPSHLCCIVMKVLCSLVCRCDNENNYNIVSDSFQMPVICNLITHQFISLHPY